MLHSPRDSLQDNLQSRAHRLSFLSKLLSSHELQRNEPLAPWTSVRVGGLAEAFVRPRTPQALVRLLCFAAQTHVPVTILGGGANTLVGDGGVLGITLKLAPNYFLEEVTFDSAGAIFTLNAGSAIARIVALMKQHKLVGAEFLAGIPGTLGGAIAMNAGTKHGEMMSVIEAVELATAQGLGWVSALCYRYRHTDIPSGAIITRARFRLRQGDVSKSQAQQQADLSYRKRTQPLKQPNFGSVFTNPSGHFAGMLIEQAGLKGHRIGNAQISLLHGNWIVNLGGATARDIVDLLMLAQERVHSATGIHLEPEVKRAGEFRT